MKNEIRNLKIAVVALFAFVLFNGAIKKPTEEKRVSPVDKRMILLVDALDVNRLGLGDRRDTRLIMRLQADGSAIIEFLEADEKVIGVITAADARKRGVNQIR